MVFQAALRLGIPFFVLKGLVSTLLIALYWLDKYHYYSGQGWVTKIITQINLSLQFQPEA